MKINKRLVELAVISPILVIFTLNHDKFLPRVKRQVGWLIDWLIDWPPRNLKLTVDFTESKFHT